MADPIRAQLADGTVLEFPAGTADDVIDRTVQAHLKGPEPSGTTWRRGIGLGAQGMTDAVANTLGAPVDLVNAGLKAAGLGSAKPIGGSETFKSVNDYIATLPGRAVDAYSAGSLAPLTESRTARLTPESTTEKVIYGGSRGIGDALTMLAGAGAVSRAAQAGGLTERVASSMAAGPAAQLVGGAVGGATQEVTGSPWAGLGAGVAAGAALPLATALAKRVVTPFPSALNSEEQRLLALAKQEGIPLPTGNVTDSRFIQQLESVNRRHPLAATIQGSADDTAQAAFNAAALKRAGVDAKTATPDVLDAARKRIGQVFEDFGKNNSLTLDAKTAQAVAAAHGQYAGRLDANVRPIVDHYAQSLAKYAPGAQAGGASTMPGSVYNSTRSALTEDIERAWRQGDGALAEALGAIRSALDDAAVRSAPKAEVAALSEARRQWANLSTIRQAMKAGTDGAVSGDITPSRLGMAVRQSQPQGYAIGRGDLNDLSRIGERFLKDKVPNSGTAERLGIGAALAGGGLYAPTMAAAAIGVPPAVAALMNTQAGRAYLQNQLLAGGKPTRAQEALAAVLMQRLKGAAEGPLVPAGAR